MRLPLVSSCLSLCLALSLAACGEARPQSASAAPAPEQAAKAAEGPPRLVVAVSIDQFSADIFAQYRPHFTGGIARLLQGAVFPAGFQSHAATETCPGHSTLLTGARPARTGIIANMWFDPAIARADKRIYCAEDEADPASTSRDPVVSARHLKVPTLGERIKAASPQSLNVAVSAKDRAVVMMGGHKIDAGYWWKGSAFTSFVGRDLSPAAVAENAEVGKLLAAGAPAFDAPAWCGAQDRAIAVGNSTVGTGRFALGSNQPDAFRASPRMDAATVDLANRLVDEMDLGKRGVTDVLSVSLSATDYVGHANGTEGMEMCIQLTQLDRTLGRLFEHLDARGIDYVVVLSADHGGLDTPERQVEQALPRAARADAALMPAALGKTLSAKTGISTSGPLLYGDGPFGDYYVSRNLPSADKARVVQALLDVVRAHPQVAAAFTAEELANTAMPVGSPQDWTLRQRARASFDAQRSGDVVVLLNRAVTPIPVPVPGAIIATHGSAWDYDRRVPILFWRKGVTGLEQPLPVETVDIAPTLAALIGLKVPDGAFDGRCLDIDGSAANSCEGPR